MRATHFCDVKGGTLWFWIKSQQNVAGIPNSAVCTGKKNVRFAPEQSVDYCFGAQTGIKSICFWWKQYWKWKPLNRNRNARFEPQWESDWMYLHWSDCEFERQLRSRCKLIDAAAHKLPCWNSTTVSLKVTTTLFNFLLFLCMVTGFKTYITNHCTHWFVVTFWRPILTTSVTLDWASTAIFHSHNHFICLSNIPFGALTAAVSSIRSLTTNSESIYSSTDQSCTRWCSSPIRRSIIPSQFAIDPKWWIWIYGLDYYSYPWWMEVRSIISNVI